MTNKWVSAAQSHSLGLNTFPGCITLTDLYGDDDHKMVIADIGTGRYNIKLKVINGVQLIAESALAEMPSAVVSFINEHTQPCLPSIAVACGSSILIYKNLKPFYKFNVPELEVNQVEVQAWKKAESKQINAQQLHVVLTSLLNQHGTIGLSSRSLTFLTCAEADDHNRMLDECLGMKLARHMSITCMMTLKRASPESTAIDCIVVGTESGHVICIDSQAFTVLKTFQISGVPVFIYTCGCYDVEFRIFVSTRDAEIFSLKRETKGMEQHPIIAVKTNILGMTRVGKQLVVACGDCIMFYTARGRQQLRLQLDQPVRCIEAFFYEPKQYTGLLVALEKEVRIYQQNVIVDSVKFDQPINWIRFGHFGREEAALVVGLKNGGLIVKLFRRTANLDDKCSEFGPPQAQNRRLNIPKRTKIYVDQAMREREQAQMMHQVFQRDMFMLRLMVNREFANLVQGSLNTISTKKNEVVEISPEINGFGPTFRMAIKLRTASDHLFEKHFLMIVYNDSMYDFDEPLIPLPALVSGKTYIFETFAHCRSPETGLTDDVHVLLMDNTRIVVGALVTMPISETNLLD